MTSKPTLKPFSSSTRPDEKWVVYWPADSPGKPRKYRRFKSKEAAQRFLAKKTVDLTNLGREAAAVNDGAAAEAAWAVKELRPFGVSLREVVQEYVERRKEAAKSAKVRDLTGDFMRVKAGAGRSARYIGDLRHKLNRFAGDFGDSLLSEISAGELEGWLAGLEVGLVTRNGFRRVLLVFFEWGRKNGFCSGNPAQATEAATEKAKACEIFSPEELRVILDRAPGWLVPVIALGAFAGLRTCEILRLDWRHVNFARGHIEVDAETSKTAKHRYVPINAALRAWIGPLSRESGPVAPPGFDKRRCNFNKDLAAATGGAVVWKDNGLRHSFASYAIVAEQDAAKVALWLGHMTQGMTFKHYRERVEEEAARRWFEVLPRKKAGRNEGEGPGG